jgi:hypothetical protein
MARPRRNSWQSLARRICACVALVCYLATAVGFPLPKLSHKHSIQPFPCQDHPCGCQTAEQCWQHCCCFSPEQRLAWAEAHDVEPPSYAERPTAQGWHSARVRDRTGTGAEASACTHCATHQTGQACSAPARKSCCDNRQDVVSCCSEKPGRPTEGTRPKRPARSHWMLGLSGLRCQGLTSLWVSVGAVLPPPVPPERTDSSLPPAWLSHRNDSPLPQMLIPPDPPPRPSFA